MGQKIVVCWLVIILLTGIGISFAEQSAGENENKVLSKETVTIFSEDFEGDFPGTNWTVGDSNPASGEDYWGISDYKSHGGSKSCWCAQVGDIYGTPNYQLHSYDYYMNAYMDVTVDISEYSSVNLTFWYWTQLSSLYDYDLLYVNTSSDGVSWTCQVAFYGISYGWQEYTIPLSSDITIIRFELYSYTNNYYGWEGAYIDDITITGTRAVTTGSISGRVMTDCIPLNNTVVTAYYACNSSLAGNDTTDENGDYVILNLPEGTYNVTATKAGYQSNTTTNVNVITGQETQNINFTLSLISTTRSVSGRVTSDGTPLQSADVTARYTSNNTIAETALTNATGDYTISNLPPDTYNVTVSKSGYTSSYQIVNLTAFSASNIDFTLNTMPTAGTITGHVYVSGTTTGIQNANVSINATTYAITDVNGAYTLSGVVQGTHTVTANATGYAPSSAEVTVTAGQTSFYNFTLTLLSETGNITGVVKDENNNTISGATVSVGGTTYSNTTDSNGLYIITGVSAGTYNVTANAADYASSSTSVTVSAGESKTQDFYLTLLSETGNITGTVTADGTALDNATVTVEGTGLTAQTNATGFYTITGVPAGTYNVTASKTGYVSSTQTNVNVTAKNTTELNFVITISAEEQRGSISGTVKDKNGNPLAFATVKAYYASNDTVAKTTTTNSTGGYTLSDLLPATYTVKISKTGFQEYSMNVTLGANQTLTSKDAELTTETGGEGGEGGGGAEGADLSGYLWIAVVIAVIIVVVLVVLKRRIPIGRRMPVREEMPPAREEILPEKPVLGKRFCIKCGSEISKTAGFCPYCGYRFGK